MQQIPSFRKPKAGGPVTQTLTIHTQQRFWACWDERHWETTRSPIFLSRAARFLGSAILSKRVEFKPIKAPTDTKGYLAPRHAQSLVATCRPDHHFPKPRAQTLVLEGWPKWPGLNRTRTYTGTKVKAKDQCWPVIHFYEEPKFPVLKNKLEWFLSGFHP
jgi:hypothetical protein